MIEHLIAQDSRTESELNHRMPQHSLNLLCKVRLLEEERAEITQELAAQEALRKREAVRP